MFATQKQDIRDLAGSAQQSHVRKERAITSQIRRDQIGLGHGISAQQSELRIGIVVLRRTDERMKALRRVLAVTRHEFEKAPFLFTVLVDHNGSWICKNTARIGVQDLNQLLQKGRGNHVVMPMPSEILAPRKFECLDEVRRGATIFLLTEVNYSLVASCKVAADGPRLVSRGIITND